MIATTFHIPMYVIFGVIALAVVITGISVIRASIREQADAREQRKYKQEQKDREEVLELIPQRWLVIHDACQKIPCVKTRQAYFQSWLIREQPIRNPLPLLSVIAAEKLAQCLSRTQYGPDRAEQDLVIKMLVPYFKLPEEKHYTKVKSD